MFSHHIPTSKVTKWFSRATLLFSSVWLSLEVSLLSRDRDLRRRVEPSKVGIGLVGSCFRARAELDSIPNVFSKPSLLFPGVLSCYSDSDCFGDVPVCDTDTNECVRAQCESDSDCAGYDLVPHCFRGECSECKKDEGENKRRRI